MSSAPANYKRVLIKLSGEALMADLDYGIDANMLKRVATEVTEVVNMGVEVALVLAAAIFSVARGSRSLVLIGSPATIWECWQL